MKVRVEAYAGYKANERPQKFCLGERWREVIEVIDRWYGPGYSYFRIKADDGCLYVLRLDETTDEWSLAATSSEPCGG